MLSSSDGFYVKCLTCLAHGPIKAAPSTDALDAWNQAGLTQEKVVAEAVATAIMVSEDSKLPV